MLLHYIKRSRRNNASQPRHLRVDVFRNVTCTCPYALTGGIPYDGWSEGMVVAEVTKGYQMPKPDHVDNKL